MSEEGGDRERERLRSTSRYSIWVGIAFIALAAIATLNTLRTDDDGVLGAGEADAGTPLPEFAVPELIGGLEGDANVFQDDCETSDNPCPPDRERTPACQIDPEGAIRVCDLFDRPLVLSFWFSDPSDCPPTQDVIDEAYRRHSDRVNFLSVAIRGEREELAATARERGWRLPIGWDRDGAVSNLYRVGVCPTVAFVLPGGILSEAKIGADELTPRLLDQQIERLRAESRGREEVR